MCVSMTWRASSAKQQEEREDEEVKEVEEEEVEEEEEEEEEEDEEDAEVKEEGGKPGPTAAPGPRRRLAREYGPAHIARYVAGCQSTKIRGFKTGRYDMPVTWQTSVLSDIARHAHSIPFDSSKEGSK